MGPVGTGASQCAATVCPAKNRCSHSRCSAVSGTIRPLDELTMSIARSVEIPEKIRAPAATKPERPIPCRQCTATFFPSSSASAIVAIRDTLACIEVGTPQSGIGKEINPTLFASATSFSLVRSSYAASSFSNSDTMRSRPASRQPVASSDSQSPPAAV